MLGAFELNRTYCGNNTDLIAGLPYACIDLTVTSPPYDNLRAYNGYTFDFETLARELYRVTKSGGVVVWVVGDATIDGSETGTSFRQALYFMECGFRLHDTMIYKTAKPPENGIRYEPEFEYMFVLSKGKPKTFNALKTQRLWDDKRKSKSFHRTEKDAGRFTNGYSKQDPERVRGNIWNITSGGGLTTKDEFAFCHPAIFPEALARDHVISWSNPGDVILDPFMGGGTTGKMAIETGRNFIGFEISQEYTALCNRRTAGAKVPLFDWTSV